MTKTVILSFVAGYIAGIVSLFVFVVIIAGDPGTTVTNDEPRDLAVSEPIETSTPTPSVPGIGDSVEVSGIIWRVNRVEDLGKFIKGNIITPDRVTNGRFLLVNFRVENASKNPRSYLRLSLVDDQGRVFDEHSRASYNLPSSEQCSIEDLNPGISLTCSQVFELPEDAKGLNVKVHSMERFGSKEALINLGL